MTAIEYIKNYTKQILDRKLFYMRYVCYIINLHIQNVFKISW